MGIFSRSKKSDWKMGQGAYGSDLIRYDGKETEITVPEYVHSLASSGTAFRDSPVEKLLLSENFRALQLEELKGHPTLRELVWTDYVNSVMQSALQDCVKLKQITVGKPDVNKYDLPVNDPQKRKHGLEFSTGDYRIEARAFKGCINLEYLELPANVAWIHGNFSDCGKLAFVWIPSSVVDLDDMAFTDSPKIKLYTDGNHYLEKYATQNNLPFKVVSSRQDMRDDYKAQIN